MNECGVKNNMKKFNVTVNGKSYEVEVEEVGGSAAAVAAPAPVAAAPAPVAAPAPKAAPAAAPAPAAAAAPAPAGAGTITAPMSGTILKSLVKPGDAVKNGQVVLILEAMKMENEIFSPATALSRRFASMRALLFSPAKSSL